MVPHIDIRPDHWDIVEGLLRRHVPQREVWAFGSRTQWTAKTYSDLDLAILGNEPLSADHLSALQEDFSESSLPWKVDVVEWSRLSDTFRQIIERDHVVVQRRHQQGERRRQVWPRLRIRDFAEVFDGPHATPPKTNAGPVFLGITSLVDGRLDLSSAEHLSEEDYVRWTRRVEPGPGDLVFSYETKIGAAALIPEGLRCCLGRRMGLIRVDRGRVDPRFLLYQFLGDDFQALLRSRTIPGSTVDRISLKEFPDFEMALPPLAEQQRIARILGTLDDKIELNRRTGKTLEAIVQAIFKSWFVDFEGSTVEAEMRDSTLSAEVGRCGGRIQTGPFGSQLHAVDYAPCGVPVVMPQDIKGRRITHDRIARVSEAKAQTLARHRLAVGDVVYSRRGDVERHALVGSREAGWLCGTGCLLVRPGPAWSSQAYLSEWLDLHDTRTWLKQHAVGATMPNLNTGILAGLPIRVPPSAALAAFEERAGPLRVSQSRLSMESEALLELRDTLLPRLLSGELAPAAA